MPLAVAVAVVPLLRNPFVAECYTDVIGNLPVRVLRLGEPGGSGRFPVGHFLELDNY